jgi:hypothetical protein
MKNEEKPNARLKEFCNDVSALLSACSDRDTTIGQITAEIGKRDVRIADLTTQLDQEQQANRKLAETLRRSLSEVADVKAEVESLRAKLFDADEILVLNGFETDEADRSPLLIAVHAALANDQANNEQKARYIRSRAWVGVHGVHGFRDPKDETRVLPLSVALTVQARRDMEPFKTILNAPPTPAEKALDAVSAA